LKGIDISAACFVHKKIRQHKKVECMLKRSESHH
jgi:hypothetical protein